MTKRLILFLTALSLGSTILLTGCNTIQGAGQDIEKAGSKVSEEAREHKRY